MVAEEAVVDVLIGGVEVVEHHVGVAGVGSCEDYDLEVFGEVFDYLLGVGSDVYACFYYLAGGEGYGQFYVVGRGEGVVAVDEGLVKIKNYGFFAYVMMQKYLRNPSVWVVAPVSASSPHRCQILNSRAL